MMDYLTENRYIIGSIAFSLALLYLIVGRVNPLEAKQRTSLLIWVVIFAAVFMLAKLTETPKVMVNSIDHIGNNDRIIIRSEIARNGSYYLQASINGMHHSEFLIDTGATISLISKSSEQASAINIDEFQKVIELQTANGNMSARCGYADVLVERITFPKLELCIAMHENLDKDILGTNFLDRFDNYKFSKNTLELVVDPKN